MAALVSSQDSDPFKSLQTRHHTQPQPQFPGGKETNGPALFKLLRGFLPPSFQLFFPSPPSSFLPSLSLPLPPSSLTNFDAS